MQEIVRQEVDASCPRRRGSGTNLSANNSSNMELRECMSAGNNAVEKHQVVGSGAASGFDWNVMKKGSFA